jgi:hypothetical protein
MGKATIEQQVVAGTRYPNAGGREQRFGFDAEGGIYVGENAVHQGLLLIEIDSKSRLPTPFFKRLILTLESLGIQNLCKSGCIRQKQHA